MKSSVMIANKIMRTGKGTNISQYEVLKGKKIIHRIGRPFTSRIEPFRSRTNISPRPNMPKPLITSSVNSTRVLSDVPVPLPVLQFFLPRKKMADSASASIIANSIPSPRKIGIHFP
jgi:hypothetical protein